MSSDEMLEAPGDLFDIAPKELEAEIECPACGVTYQVQGSYRPIYHSVILEEAKP